jgi:hypothetical protein
MNLQKVSKPGTEVVKDSSHTLAASAAKADPNVKRETFHDFMKVRFPEASYNTARDRYEFTSVQDVTVGAAKSKTLDVQRAAAETGGEVYQSRKHDADKQLVIVENRFDALAHAELNKKGVTSTRYMAADISNPQHKEIVAKEISAIKENNGRVVVVARDVKQAASIAALAQERNVPVVTLKPKEGLEQTLKRSKQRNLEQSL